LIEDASDDKIDLIRHAFRAVVKTRASTGDYCTCFGECHHIFQLNMTEGHFAHDDNQFSPFF